MMVEVKSPEIEKVEKRPDEDIGPDEAKRLKGNHIKENAQK